MAESVQSSPELLPDTGSAVEKTLVDEGAEVHAIDVSAMGVNVAKAYEVDLRDPSAVIDTSAAIPGEVDVLFNCAVSVAGPTERMSSAISPPRLAAIGPRKSTNC